MAEIALVPAGVSLVVAALLRGDDRWRLRFVLYVVGVAAGIAVFVAADPGEVWRGVALGPDTAIVGLGIAASFFVAATGRATGGWRVGALLGIAASGVALGVGSRWIVPAVLFWECGSVALAAIARDGRDPATAWLTIFLSDALLIAALTSSAVEGSTWAMPARLAGWPGYLAVAAVVMRSGAIPYVGVWRLAGSAAAAAIPLWVAGAFAVGVRLVFGADALEGAVVLAAALAIAAWSATGRSSIEVVAAWPPLLALGLALVAPDAGFAAGIAAVLGGCAVALWSSDGAAGMARAFVFSFAPPGPGFWAVSIATTHAVARVGGADNVLEEVPWTLVVALVPLGLAAGVAVSVRVARANESADTTGRWAAGAPAVAALAIGLWPADALGLGPVVARVPVATTVVLVVAVAVGAIAWLIAARRTAPSPETALAGPALTSRRLGRRTSLVLTWLASGCALGAIATTLWLTYEGLRVGFL